MRTFASSDHAFLLDHPQTNHPTRHQVPVKIEASASPDLSPAPPSLQHFTFKFHPHPSPSHASLPSSRHSSDLNPQPIYRFGSDHPSYNFMSTWPNSHHSPPSASTSAQNMSGHINGHSKYDLGPSHQPFQYADDYDNVDLVDLPMSGGSSIPGTALSASSEKTVRRRSSKACDQCRKSKCKCERSAPGDACKSCVMLGIPCTFLGPSRKRGPPKGYIDAIEARLHQMEALLGIIISSTDSRAQTLLRDLAKDPLAKEIINRVDNSPYGIKGRKRENGTLNSGSKTRFSHITSPNNSDGDGDKSDGPRLDLTSTHPSNEWQDRVGSMLRTISSGSDESYATDSVAATSEQHKDHSQSQKPALRVDSQVSRSGRPQTSVSDDSSSPSRRQRRRIDSDSGFSYDNAELISASTSALTQSQRESISSYASLSRSSRQRERQSGSRGSGSVGRRSISPSSVSGESENELTGAVGQLSLNEDEQVRFHGKASGLHLLSGKERIDSRNAGGIWRFPGARVWPPLPSGFHQTKSDMEYMAQLPDPAVQGHLLDLYFTYVHPSFPVIHRHAFFDAFRNNADGETPIPSEASDATGLDEGNRAYSPFNRRRRQIPPLLLFAMFAVAARYEDADNSGAPAPPADLSTMWTAGDEYLDHAKMILDDSYAASRPATCQALLLMGYREIGIGAMAQAWTYIGMAIRMAQDLGMHRSADKWARVGLGGRLFGDRELDERKRIWYGCVIMDKYVSTYIGRPLMIFEQDFDTLMPDENDPEENEEWMPHEHRSSSPDGKLTLTVPARIVSCFNASASLSNILGEIVEDIYAVRPQISRHAVLATLEGHLDKWYIGLPEHLRFEPSSASSRQKTVLPHVLTLHMQYWCAVLLLHRPFVRQFYHSKHKSPVEPDDPDTRMMSDKSYELCAGAANHITSIVSLYQEKFTLKRPAIFLCYYVFTASVMHAASLSVYPDDPQARVGLSKCMEALQLMQIMWPSAGRALELLTGAKMNLKAADGELSSLMSSKQHERMKRPASHMAEDATAFDRTAHGGTTIDYPIVRQHGHEHQQPPQAHPSQDAMHRHDAQALSYSNEQDVYTAGSLEVQPTHQQQQQQPPHQGISASMVAGGSVSHSVLQNYSSYDRWISSAGTNSGPFSGPLSTSVLPQLYSTGLVDDRVPSVGQRVSTHAASHGAGGAHTHGQRYPQYWNDYSTYSQLGPAYGSLQEQQQQQQQQTISQSAGTASQPQMYISEPYNIYNDRSIVPR
ncbi:hypothetical protein AX17_006995 [Amanita inopinata Kibby_2008]|nr:hypothetical protein AX17_006995 [Amanita inopinata Kibby_2008]